jgi:hypothetical protein
LQELRILDVNLRQQKSQKIAADRNMNAGEGDVSDQEEFDLGDDLDVQQDEYFPFDDEPAFALNASLYGPAGAASNSFSSAPLPSSSNLPLSSHHISSLNQSIMDQATANVQTHLTAYELHVMQSQVQFSIEKKINKKIKNCEI